MYNAIINPIASLLGKILDVLFVVINSIGLGNIAIAIVLFTIITKVLMLPLVVKQSKMTKLNSIIAPEIKAIQEKYKDKKNDQNAMLKMQDETKAVYAKYGTSQMGGCVQLLIQFPILMALYRVVQNIPLYVGSIKDLLMGILGNGQTEGIMSVDNFATIMSENFSIATVRDWSNVDQVLVAMNSFTSEQWTKLTELFPQFADVITTNQAQLFDMNTLFSINVSQVPQLGLNISIIIPILAGLSQFISAKISQGRQQDVDDDNPAAASMKMMTLFMPIMSVFLAFSVPAGLGIYWIFTAVVQTIIQLLVNRYFDKLGVEEIVKRNIEKRNKKRAKKGLPPEKIAKNAIANTKKIDSAPAMSKAEALQAKKEENDRRMKEILDSTSYYKSAKPGSLAEKAGMVAKYNEKNNKK